ncbi:MAG TPA: hypothetical protein VG367_10385 [Mucilaginibacter sp.]|jgi:hypothetical protein|nr:hypothetical protein [Mucilaginibacter sp.]
MGKKFLLFGLIFGALIVFTTNFSCKKNNQNYLSTLLTDGHWQFASLVVTYKHGDTTISTDTVFANCSLTQNFTFNSNGTCTYKDFSCLPQTATGHWAFSSNYLFLMSNINLKDTLSSDNPVNGSSAPFQNAQIVNLGQYSLILRTGDLEQYYAPGQARTINEYGFVRVKSQ